MSYTCFKTAVLSAETIWILKTRHKMNFSNNHLIGVCGKLITLRQLSVSFLMM